MVSLLHSSVWIALITSASVAAAPPAPAPTPAPAAQAASVQTDLPGAPDSMERRIALGYRFVALTVSVDNFLDGIKAGFAGSAIGELEETPAEGFLDQVSKDAELIGARLEPQARKSFPRLADAFAKAYAREFSAAELEQLIAFAQSPTGGHFLAEGMNVAQDPAVLSAYQLMMSEMEPTLLEIRREHCAKRAQQRIAAGDTKAKCPLAEQSAAG